MAENPDERHRMLDTLRASAPVFRDQASMSFILTRMDDARALLTDNSLWKDADRAEEGALVHKFKPPNMNRPGDRNAGIGWMDNPHHARVRPPIAQALVRRVTKLRPQVEAICAARLNALTGRTQFDVVGDYAVPIPIEVIGRLLGVDTRDMQRFRAWSEASMKSFLPDPTLEEAAEVKATSEALTELIDALLADRRRAPADDLISDLLAVQAETGALSDSEIRVNAFNMLAGGNVTTADLIASAAWLLLTHSGERVRLAADPSLVSAAIEETLRLEPPTEGAQRVASRDMQIRSCPVRQGQVVAVLLHAANRDPAVFPDPHRFDLSRKGSGHIAFGGGQHLCIGGPLARLEAQVAVAALFARFADLRLADPDTPPAWRAIPYFRGLDRLPVRTGAGA
jgi:cytochrome P450